MIINLCLLKCIVHGSDHSCEWKARHVALAIGDPRWLDQLLSVHVQNFVNGADSSVADTDPIRDLFCRFRFTEEVRSHVDACGGDRQRRTSSAFAKVGYVLGETCGHDDELLILETNLTAVAATEFRGLRGLGILVRLFT